MSGRTRGKSQITAEIDPGLKERVQAYAASERISEAEVVRRTLSMVFSVTSTKMDGNGRPEQEAEAT